MSYNSALDLKYVSDRLQRKRLFPKYLDLIFFSPAKAIGFPQPRKSSTAKQVSHNQKNFPQSRNFCTRKFYLIKEVFYKQVSFLHVRKVPQIILLNLENFLQTMKFSTKVLFSTNIDFYTVTKCFINKDQKGFLKAKYLICIICILPKSKKHILMVDLRNYAKINFKRLYKNVSCFFSRIFCNIFEIELIQTLK